MSLWGCQFDRGFLACAGATYSTWERTVLGAIVILIVSCASMIVLRFLNRDEAGR